MLYETTGESVPAEAEMIWRQKDRAKKKKKKQSINIDTKSIAKIKV